MHLFILSLFWLLILFSLIYILIIGTITTGWFRIKYFKKPADIKLPHVSIVIAVRNERKHIEKLLKELILQDYPSDHFEIVIINDHSEDTTKEIIELFVQNNKTLNVKALDARGEGKKAALREGVNEARYDLIVTTDGDCSVGESWLKRLVEYYEDKKPKLIVGPVVYERKKGFMQHFYMLDFISLVASGAGSLGAGFPLMANGANLTFSRQTFIEMQPVQVGESHASGDDVFLLHAISKNFGAKSVHFIKDALTIVSTEPPDDFNSFLSQRKRWASKTTGYRSWWPILVSISVFLLNLLLVLSFLTTFLKTWFLIIFGLFVLLKIMIDFPLLQYFAEFANRKKSVPYLFIFGFFYPFYIIITGFSSLFFHFNWRDRKNLK